MQTNFTFPAGSKTAESYIVQFTFNNSQHSPGEVFYGPFTLEDAKAFAQNFDADDTEVEDVRLIVLNLAVAKGLNAEVEWLRDAYEARDIALSEVAALKQARDTGIKAVEYRVLADLRAKVVLEHWLGSIYFDTWGRAWFPADEVLALIDRKEPNESS